MPPVRFDRDINPTEITIHGRTYPIERMGGGWAGLDEQGYVSVYYRARGGHQMVQTLKRYSARVCKQCGKIVPHGSNMHCSKKCRGRYYNERSRAMASYIDDVPEYLRKYMVVVKDGEKGTAQNKTRL